MNDKNKPPDETKKLLAAERENYALALQMSRIESRRANEAEQQLAAEERRANDSIEENVRLMNRLATAVAALKRLSDCDFVITLPDRMDAVREIARAALENIEQGK